MNGVVRFGPSVLNGMLKWAARQERQALRLVFVVGLVFGSAGTNRVAGTGQQMALSFRPARSSGERDFANARENRLCVLVRVRHTFVWVNTCGRFRDVNNRMFG